MIRSSWFFNFNPRTPAKECDPREGVRLEVQPCRLRRDPISIHAPPRRSATFRLPLTKYRFVISIHAPPRRSATGVHGGRVPPEHYFNPRTPAKECDLGLRALCMIRTYFNPRTPAKECDVPLSASSMAVIISIHAPPRRSATWVCHRSSLPR